MTRKWRNRSLLQQNSVKTFLSADPFVYIFLQCFLLLFIKAVTDVKRNFEHNSTIKMIYHQVEYLYHRQDLGIVFRG